MLCVFVSQTSGGAAGQALKLAERAAAAEEKDGGSNGEEKQDKQGREQVEE